MPACITCMHDLPNPFCEKYHSPLVIQHEHAHENPTANNLIQQPEAQPEIQQSYGTTYYANYSGQSIGVWSEAILKGRQKFEETAARISGLKGQRRCQAWINSQDDTSDVQCKNEATEGTFCVEHIPYKKIARPERWYKEPVIHWEMPWIYCPDCGSVFVESVAFQHKSCPICSLISACGVVLVKTNLNF